MARRITVVCNNNHKEELIIGSSDKIKVCPKCKEAREILWDQPGVQGAPGFRIQGMTKKF